MRTADRYVAQNRRARHDYLIEDTIEAGVVLLGTEVKVLRQGQASITEAYADQNRGELYLVNANIPEYAASAHFNHQPRRPRKLLLHRKQMNRLLGAIQRDGITVVPLSIYFNERGRAKIELGLARGKRKADKRQAEKQRDWPARSRRLTRPGANPIGHGEDASTRPRRCASAANTASNIATVSFPVLVLYREQ